MKKFLRKFLIWTGLTILLLIVLLIIIAAAFEKPIGKRILKEVNKQLATELVVENFKLSLISGFPNASAELKNVRLESSLDGPLLEAETLAFRFGLFSLFGDNIKVKSILIQNGELNIVQSDARGRTNYDIAVASEQAPDTTQAEGSLSLSIDQAELDNVEIAYLDVKSRQRLRAVVENAAVSGRFSGDQLTINSSAAIFSRYFELEGTRYASSAALSYDARLDLDLAAGRYELKDVRLGVGDTDFQLGGWVQQTGRGMDLDLDLSSSEGSLGAMLALLPKGMLKSLTGLESKGKFRTEVSAKGRYSPRSMPAIEAKVSLDKGRITTDMLDEPLKDVSFEAYFTNGKERNAQTSVFELRNFKGYFNKEWVEMELGIANLDNMLIDFKMDGAMPVDAALDFFSHPSITRGGGEVEFRNVAVKGRYNDMIRSSRVNNVDMRGDIIFDDAMLEINKKKLIMDRGQLLFDGNTVTVESIHLEGPDTDLKFDGMAQNFLPVLLADSLNTLRAELKFDGKLYASRLDIDQMMAFSAIPFAEGEAPEEVIDSMREQKNVRRERITDFLDGSFEARIEEFNYNKIDGKDFFGKMEFKNNELNIEGSTKAMGGKFEVEGKGYFEKAPYLELKMLCENVDVSEFLEQSENFGQEVLTSKNLMGTLESKIAIYAYWDTEGNFLMDKLNVLADVNINDGELRDFELLYDYSDYIDIDELRRIKFTTLQNWLEIDNGRLYIPVMFIQSTAMNLTLSGEHTFEQDIDYYFKINAGQVLSQKLKNKDSLAEMVPTRRKDWFNLYVHLFGDIENYQYNMKAREVKTHFSKTDRRKESIKRKLMEEFGPIINLDEPVSWKDDIPEYEEEEPEKIEYLDGFEDEDQN